jgi:hypothetical protein
MSGECIDHGIERQRHDGVTGNQLVLPNLDPPP